MKKISKITTLIFILIMMFTLVSYAASVNHNIYSSKNSYVKGENVTITLSFTGQKINSVVSVVTYPDSILEYTGSSADISNKTAAGVVKVNKDDINGNTNFIIELYFKAKSAGNATIIANSSGGYDYNENGENKVDNFSLSAATSVTVTNPAPTVSSNANLSSLYVSAGSLSPSFSAGRTSYTVYVDEDETVCLISAEAQDSGATIDVTGSKNLIIGRNVRSVIVTAPSGNTKTYTITIYRGEASSEGEEEKPDDEKVEEIITVIGETSYVIQENIKSEDVPEEFLLVVGKYEGKDIPLVKSVDLKYTLALLKNQETGDLKWFFFNEESGAFTETVTMTTDEAMLFAKLSANDTKEKDDSLFGDNEIILFLILGSTVLLLAIVIIVLQFKIVKGKKKKKNKKVEELKEEVPEENAEEIQKETEEKLDEE